jgi:hypothetical protein
MEYMVMSDDDRSTEGEERRGEGVFGKLPSARPGVRSPRRSEPATREKARPPGSPTGTPGDPGRARSAPPPPRRAPPGSPKPPRASPPEEPEPAREGHGVEDLAWAGITVAAEAATLGVRLLSRAVDAVRKPVDRP